MKAPLPPSAPLHPFPFHSTPRLFIFQPPLLPASIRHARSRVGNHFAELPKNCTNALGNSCGGILRQFEDVQIGWATNLILRCDTETCVHARVDDREVVGRGKIKLIKTYFPLGVLPKFRCRLFLRRKQEQSLQAGCSNDPSPVFHNTQFRVPLLVVEMWDPGTLQTIKVADEFTSIITTFVMARPRPAGRSIEANS